MKDKIEQIYISAIQGEWDSAYFAEQMMELISPSTMLTLPELSKEECERLKNEINKCF